MKYNFEFTGDEVDTIKTELENTIERLHQERAAAYQLLDDLRKVHTSYGDKAILRDHFAARLECIEDVLKTISLGVIDGNKRWNPKDWTPKEEPEKKDLARTSAPLAKVVVSDIPVLLSPDKKYYEDYEILTGSTSH